MIEPGFDVGIDVDAALDIIEYVNKQTLQIGDLEVTLGSLFVYDQPLKGLYKQIRHRIEKAICEALGSR